jgi:hypothetical protein
LQIRRWKVFSLVIACLIAPAAAKAAPVDWTLNDVVLSDPGFYDISLQGSFDYDADTTTYSDVSVSLWGHYGQEYSTIPIYSTTVDSVTFGYSSNSSGLYTLFFGSPLIDAGGDVSLTGGGSGYELDSGAYLSAPEPATATPEPGTLLLVFSGLGGMILRRRQRA